MLCRFRNRSLCVDFYNGMCIVDWLKSNEKKKASGLNKQILEKAVIDDMVLGDRGRDNRHETNKVNWNVVIHMSTTSDRLRL